MVVLIGRLPEGLLQLLRLLWLLHAVPGLLLRLVLVLLPLPLLPRSALWPPAIDPPGRQALLLLLGIASKALLLLLLPLQLAADPSAIVLSLPQRLLLLLVWRLCALPRHLPLWRFLPLPLLLLKLLRTALPTIVHPRLLLWYLCLLLLLLPLLLLG